VPFNYQSGEEKRKGDRVLFHDHPGEIEFVADPLVSDVETDWYVQEYGGGVMVVEPTNFGHVFLTETQEAEDLIFVARRTWFPRHEGHPTTTSWQRLTVP